MAARTLTTTGSRTRWRTLCGRERTSGTKRSVGKPAASPRVLPRVEAVSTSPPPTTPPPETSPPPTSPPPPPRPASSRDPVRRLQLNGAPYRFTGLNIYNANSVNNCWYTLGTGDGLDSSLADIGAGKEAFRAWFFQYQATRSGARDWSVFDHTLAVARARGVKVVATLTNQWGQCEGYSYPTGYRTESWYQSGYRTTPGPGVPATFREWVAEVVTRYKDDPTILAWQLVNEAEAKTAYSGSCSATAAASLKAFTADTASLVKSIDRNHLLSLGTIGSGQCGATSSAYKDLHSVPDIDLCEYHDYSSAAMPGDQWNGLATRLSQCNELGKPLFVGELGIQTSPVVALLDRANLLRSKLSAQFQAGVAGVLAWDWRDAAHGGSSLSGYEIGPSDPALGCSRRTEPSRRRARAPGVLGQPYRAPPGVARDPCRRPTIRAASSPTCGGWSTSWPSARHAATDMSSQYTASARPRARGASAPGGGSPGSSRTGRRSCRPRATARTRRAGSRGRVSSTQPARVIAK